MGPEKQFRLAISDAVAALIARGALPASASSLWTHTVYHVEHDALGIHAPERTDSPVGEVVGADDGGPDAPAADPSP